MFSLSPKAIGAFIEYTLKPLIDDARELMDVMQERGFNKADLAYAYKLMVWQMVTDMIKTIVVTGMICWTLFFVLSHSPHMIL